MIEVQHLQENFVKTVKEPGLREPCARFVHKQTVKLLLKFQRADLLSGQMVLGSQPPSASTDKILKPHLTFVGLTADSPG